MINTPSPSILLSSKSSSWRDRNAIHALMNRCSILKFVSLLFSRTNRFTQTFSALSASTSLRSPMCLSWSSQPLKLISIPWHSEVLAMTWMTAAQSCALRGNAPQTFSLNRLATSTLTFLSPASNAQWQSTLKNEAWFPPYRSLINCSLMLRAVSCLIILKLIPKKNLQTIAKCSDLACKRQTSSCTIGGCFVRCKAARYSWIVRWRKWKDNLRPISIINSADCISPKFWILSLIAVSCEKKSAICSKEKTISSFSIAW